MSKKIIGVTVGTPISPSKIQQKLNPVKTVNGKSPDANGNVELIIPDGADYVLTDDDKSEIANKVIAQLGGEPIFGYVDENNNIILSGNLAEDTYNVKYEMEDGTTVDIGDLVLTNSYTVTNSLTNCTTNNSATSVAKNGSYSATISAKSGYTLSSVTVTMGGSPVTVTNGVINISKVTGDIVITASAKEADVYYTVTKNLTNCTISNAATSVLKGSSYSATISANSGYELSSATVTMGGSSVTVSNGVINIASVTGNIVITASAVQKVVEPTYKNLAEPLPNNTTDTSKWVNGQRISSSGISAQSGKTVTNMISCKNGDVIRIKGVNLVSGTDRIAVFGTTFSTWAAGYFNNGIDLGSSLKAVAYNGLADGVYTFTVTSDTTHTYTGLRIAMTTPSDANAVIITKNEEIV